jgi:galactokinase/mevalonate kinase-like predicted kinase
LAAMMLANNSVEHGNALKSTLIIHAGGESSRCPTQMVLGKSWTTLPCAISDADPSCQAATNKIQSPTSLMVHRIMDLLEGLPKGSLVVAASDTLLKLDAAKVDWSSVDENAVIGVAVPAPLATAKNHGVYVLNKNDDTSSDAGDDIVIQPVHDFLQKPSIETMTTTPNASFTSLSSQQQQTERCAWIDTGIVIFLPKAAHALRDLATNELACCCWDGLEGLWKKAEDPSAASPTTLQAFAQQQAKKVELYTHLLMALATTRTSTTLQDYLQRHSDLPTDILTAIYKHLSPFSLQALVVPQGQFLHLGTSKELVRFLVQNMSSDSKQADSLDDIRSQRLGRELKLVSNYESILEPLAAPEASKSFVSYNSLILTTGELEIGGGTVLEHVHVHAANVDIRIGQGCLVSGWRNENLDTNAENAIVLTDKTCLQVMPLLASDGDNTTKKYVVMMFGLEDDIKGWTRVHGVDTSTFLQETGLADDDLWAPTETKKLLWTAKLHPIVNEVDLPKLFSWIQPLQEAGKIIDKSVLDYYKSCRKVSLQSIRKLSNAQAEWKYRFNLERLIIPLHQNLSNRQHVECRLTSESNDLETTLSTLSTICWKAMAAKNFDIAGRAFMVGSALCADSSKDGTIEATSIPQDLQSILYALRSDENGAAASKRLFVTGDDYVQASKLGELSLALEQAASIMTERCVSGSTKTTFPHTTSSHATMNTWVVATAPARVDLSGGWSDTPPICYEYGGAVAGLAVTVDGRNPLSCRCRIIPGNKGVRLVNESRDAATGDLLSKVETVLKFAADLKDCRDPMATCALIKCALVYLGLLPDDAKPTDPLTPLLQTFCKMTGGYQPIGLEIISTSLLPRGSGMGTSSILAGCVLASIAQCVGIDLNSTGNDNGLIDVVLSLEQLLTCGGGWQDQIGGLVGGLKLGTSPRNEFPVEAQVERIPLSSSIFQELNERLILVFTGQTRLAKNILQNVLRRWARRTPEIVRTVEALVRDANRVVSQALVDSNNGADQEDKLQLLAECLNNYWSQKKVMAGDDSGVDPPVVKFALSELMDRKEIVAGSLCGAGGGGFMVLLAAKGRSMADIQATCDKELVSLNSEVSKFTWHSCEVSLEGLVTTTLESASLDTTSENDMFDMKWHKPTATNDGQPPEKCPRISEAF